MPETLTTTEVRPQAVLLCAEDVAAMLGCSPTHVWRGLHAAAKLPKPVKIGRLTRWRRAEILAWIEAGCPPRVAWHWVPRANDA